MFTEPQVFNCPHCHKTGNYFRLVRIVNKEAFTPFHETAFTTQTRKHIGQKYFCSSCNLNVTKEIEPKSKG